VVKGKVKGSGYRLGEPVDGANDYCMIYVQSSWRFVDPHWGSSSLNVGLCLAKMVSVTSLLVYYSAVQWLTIIFLYVFYY